MPHKLSEQVVLQKEQENIVDSLTLQEQVQLHCPERVLDQSLHRLNLPRGGGQLIKRQVALLTGHDYWRTTALPSCGLPAIKTTDGPNGARGEQFTNGTPAALFPCGASLAATWDPTLIENLGIHLGAEARARGANVLLAPTVCLHRSPLGGRNFESFSEDPFLTGKLAISYVRGLQSQGVAATMKHFVANEQETRRVESNSIISERALRELYLKPFEMTIRDCPPYAVMTAYNLVNGVHCDQNFHLLRDILRGEWNFQGLVMSDWGGITSTKASLLAGCDLEMPYSNKWRSKKLIKLLSETDDGDSERTHVSSANKLPKARKVRDELRHAVKQSAANVVKLVNRTQASENPAGSEERTRNDPKTAQSIYEAGVAGLTLLKNEGDILPLSPSTSIAVIGPNANRTIANGGGSASLNPEYRLKPFEVIKRHCTGNVRYAQGCESWKWVPLASDYCIAPNGTAGVMLEYFEGPHFQGRPVRKMHKTTTDLYLWDSPPESLRNSLHSFRVTTRILPTTTGEHTFGFSSVGPGRLLVNGEVFIDNWDWTEAGEAMFGNSKEIVKRLAMRQGEAVDVVVESTNEIRPRAKIPANGPNFQYGGCRIGYLERPTRSLLEEAVEAAKASEVAVVIVGLDAEWESEGYDRPDMDLPKDGSQDRLVSAVAAANPNTIVVNQSGSPVTMPWAANTPGILQAWYQGQEAANALADVLFGVRGPGGRLPVTFPKRLEDSPAHRYGIVDGLDVYYDEDIFLGYRYYQSSNTEPLFPFGHGLSYSKFQYGEPQQSQTTLTANSELVIQVPVMNIGQRAASEVVQVYVHAVAHSGIPRADRELKGFAKVFLNPHQTSTATITLDKHAAGYYETKQSAWVALAGTYELLIGSSSADIRTSSYFVVQDTFSWVF